MSSSKLYCWYSYFAESDSKLLDGFISSLESIKYHPQIDHIYAVVTIPSQVDRDMCTSVLESLNDEKCTVSHNISDNVAHFDNFHFINDTSRFNDNDRIIFMHNDDLLISIPDEVFQKDVMQGKYYVSEKTVYEGEGSDGQISSIQQVLEDEHKLSDTWMISIDFSGYIVKYSVVTKYFDERNQKDPKEHDKLRTLEDIIFMKFADNYNPSNPPKPTVFHRKFPGQDSWKDQTLDIIEQAETQYNDMQLVPYIEPSETYFMPYIN